MSKSIKHHFIPQWQLKFWSDGNDRVIVVDRRNKNKISAFVTHTKNVFAHDYLYSIRDENGGNDDTLERQIYGPLDNAANALTEEVISILDRDATPNMNKGARAQFWQFHFYNAFKRHPESMRPYIEKLDYNELRQESIQNAINSGEDDKIIRQVTEGYDLKSHIEKEGVQYARAEQNSKVMSKLGEMGILFAIAPDNTSFILPDHPFEIGTANQQSEKIWIPIHPKYAVRPHLLDGKCNRIHLKKSDVRKLNEYWYGLANAVVSISKLQLVSLVKNHDRHKIKFLE